MKITFLGTNGWYDTKTGNTLCTLLSTGREHIILDAGNGFYKIDRHIKDKKPIYLFLSHYHIDHIAGLHILPKFNFRQGITVFGPPGLKKFFSTVIAPPYTASTKHIRTRIRLVELSSRKKKLPVDCEYLKLDHISLCFGYRFEIRGRIISYCTDTGPCKNYLRLAKNTDILISECAFLTKERSARWPHLNPESAAALAKKAGAKKLILVHFDASRYDTMLKRKKAQKQARRIFPNTFAAKDDWVMNFL